MHPRRRAKLYASIFMTSLKHALRKFVGLRQLRRLRQWAVRGSRIINKYCHSSLPTVAHTGVWRLHQRGHSDHPTA
jgi:hypothetical protein